MTNNTTYITDERTAQQINDIALTLGIEKPYNSTYIRNDRLWRNWLDAVEQVCEQHGRIPLMETGGQLSFDLGDA
jgi:hypothetical protein